MLKKFHEFINEQTTTLSQKQIDFLNRYVKIKGYEPNRPAGLWIINPITKLVDVVGDFEAIGINDLCGISFGKLTGNFECTNGNLTSLKGAPQEVTGNFFCSNNSLSSLIGGPISVGEAYSCANNNLTNLIGSPKNLGGHLLCDKNRLITLKGLSIPIRKNYYFEDNPLPSNVLKASLKSPKEFYKALAKAIKYNLIDYSRWPAFDPEWISIF